MGLGHASSLRTSMSQIEKRFSDSGSGKDDLATQIAISKLLSLLDTDTRAKIMAGENVEFTPQSASPALSQAILHSPSSCTRCCSDTPGRYRTGDESGLPCIAADDTGSTGQRRSQDRFQLEWRLGADGAWRYRSGSSPSFSPSNAIVCAAAPLRYYKGPSEASSTDGGGERG